MQCANPQCSKELLYLRDGRLELIELESDSDDQVRPDDGAFAMKSLPSKFFWLCGECTKIHIIKRWTTSGLFLVPRKQNIAGSLPTHASSKHAAQEACAIQPTRQPAVNDAWDLRSPGWMPASQKHPPASACKVSLLVTRNVVPQRPGLGPAGRRETAPRLAAASGASSDQRT
jgi:hypothetical protein